MSKEKFYLKGDQLLDISDYNFKSIKNALKLGREKTIQKIKDSELKGRGGAGFPTGIKWEMAANIEAQEKFLVCNGDEGEPGTFKDRYLLEERPLKVLEGIMLAAYAVGADKAYIYIRGEYSKAIDVFSKIIEAAEKEKILNEYLFNSDFKLELKLVRGAGAYVCGDETSLLNSIEGKRGRSRIKPPYPIEKGLYNQPTVVNNVESLCCAAEILNPESEEFSSLGIEGSRGTKLLCLSGDLNKPGLYEVEFGKITLKEIIYELGGGIKTNADLRFVVPGGISTSLIKADSLDFPYSYQEFEERGSSLGSGAVIAVSKKHDLLDLMLNVSRFYMDETCGTCFPCREGNRQINKILKSFKPESNKINAELINDIGNTIRLAARCGLGQSSLNFITSVIQNYGEELRIGGKIYV
ncbi:complex I 51 kDa subunit family protein [Halanaerobium congolense]|jgi:NADH-quinone oxidoreductase subunit F|uniref:NADH-quinone oxidoreductase subunit F n=1 Tax=Halanaerobium congolense TaxID=54121 RepID=A0A1G9RYN4_9FIRM|nr:NADH-ubiquinone oxidoreductase-F iron-sulfur binding region domain-containing protein [Halanaerobium congolense]PUU88101.1 MAG: NADH dehydrogenase (quinone) [Halanaerobium sp.]PXV67885.1 NADH:ubiquinone oxidoreductase subunit F (NADH-binding) [Halanaerobium congolense]TDP12466.1 NADH:ubiquinone oxidoreductase subunit F (NADH-binding) [Halanaerobium congolense]TDS35335.1 NADH-quinone oxidoreductase subunit F [Halanaerobium congolense]SDK63008.1 NADH-quinone oxidoreductase subunit F [Halanaer